MAARGAMNALQSSFALSEYESGTYPTGGLRFEKIVRFATVDCSKAGWLRKSNGKWSITEAGKQALVTYQNSGEFYREAVRLYRDWKDNQILDDSSGTDPLPDGEEADEAKIVGVTFEKAEEQESISTSFLNCGLSTIPNYQNRRNNSCQSSRSIFWHQRTIEKKLTIKLERSVHQHHHG
jgi:hypothetical protein